MTVTTPTIWYANYGDGSTTGYFAVAKWALNTGYTVGQIIRQKTAPAVGSERCFICITAGTSSNTTEPTWSTGSGTKTTDAGGPVYMECTGRPSLNNDLTDTPLSSQNRSGAQALGNLITNNSQDHYFICTTAGTTGAGEPTYSTSTGATTVDSGCTWTCLGAVGSFVTNWGAPIARIATAISYVPTGIITGTAGTLYVSASHAETQSSAMSLTIGGANNRQPINIICIANAPSALPPAAGDITTGATATTTGNAALSIPSPSIVCNGISFSCGTGANAPILQIGQNSTTGAYVKIINGGLSTPTSAASLVEILGTVELVNVTMTFGSTANQGIQFTGCNFVWRDTPSALAATTWPTNLFVVNGTTMVPSAALVEGVDLSAFAGTALCNGGVGMSRIVISHCKLSSAAVPTASSTFLYGYLDVINSDTGSATYNTMRFGMGGLQSTSTTVIATNGASDGTTSYSWKLQGNNGNIISGYYSPFEAIPISIWNTTTGANVTVTLQGAFVGTALPFNDDIWFDCVYFGTSGSTLSTRKSGGKATIRTSHSQYSASSTLWGSAAPARQNTHGYSAGDVIGVSSGGSIVRAFVCTTAGTSSGSQPGGYGSAVDGSQITDGTAVFTAVERFSMALTLTTPQPQAAGYLVLYVHVADQNSTFYIDPNPALS